MKITTTTTLLTIGLLLGGCATKVMTPGAGPPGAETPSPSTAATTAPSNGSQEPGSLALLQRAFADTAGDVVYFDFDSYVLTPEARQQLERQASWLRAHPEVRMMIAGNCDERGTRTYNLALGARRSNAARDFLVARGLPFARFTTVSYGKERPQETGATEAAWARNRNARSVLIELAFR